MEIAILGSAFDPPTCGHQDVIQYVLNLKKFDKLLLIPSYQHAFSKQMLDYKIRLQMLSLFVADLNDKRVEALPIEHRLAVSNKPVYTFDLLHHLHTHNFEHDALSFVVGPDNQQNWHKFYKATEVTQQWSLIVAPERKNIRSTMIREALKKGDDVSDWVTPSVNHFLQTQKPYF